MSTTKPAKPYIELKQQLDELLLTMQSDDLDIDQAIALHTQGMALITELETYLKTAQNKVEKIKASFDASPKG